MAVDGRARRRRRTGVDLEPSTLELLEQYRRSMERRGVRPGSVDALLSKIRLWCEHVHPRSPLETDAEEIERWLDERSLVPRSRYAYVSLLHGFFEWAVRAELADRDPTIHIVRPRAPRHMPRPMQDEDLAAALREAPPTLKAMITLGKLSTTGIIPPMSDITNRCTQLPDQAQRLRPRARPHGAALGTDQLACVPGNATIVIERYYADAVALLATQLEPGRAARARRTVVVRHSSSFMSGGMEGGNPDPRKGGRSDMGLPARTIHGIDEWKTGQRVPFTGNWVDQYGVISHHAEHATFPPCIGRKGECAWRRPV